ncbi:MAG: putative methyltransferase [Pelotomaculum sp. PtaU1.Bin035]|nr:MAG: putative methyltransferase [Pelotomaculum sp. PtaU1.Bin035]
MSPKTNKPEEMDIRSMDISNDNRTKLKQLFPSVFTETRNDKGELVESIDFEKLKAELGTFSDVFESRRERYGMDWPGKKECMKLIQQPSVGTLKPCREESVNFDTTENLFIEGDNLEVLKLLQKSYYGKIKMIYIDPPYNTGNEFIYPDNYSESLDTYLAYAGLIDANGRKFSTNTPNEGRFHTKWLNMMYPRLYLARNLLREDGVIFISIDDNELCNLKNLCSDVFGEENLIEVLVWKRRATPPNDRVIGKNHEYILAYGRNTNETSLYLQQKEDHVIARYKNPDNDPNGPWIASDLSANGKGGRLVDSCIFPIHNPLNKKDYYPPRNKCWLYSKEKVEKFIKEGRISFRESTGAPYLKRYFKEVRNGSTMPTILDDAGFSQDSAREIRSLFGADVYEFPKPIKLLNKLIVCGLGPNDILMDFFAGSCTTAQAVLELNKIDGGNRKFIMVQLPEPCDEDSEAYKTGYKTIANIGKERIIRAIKKIEEEQIAKTKESNGMLPGLEEQPLIDLGIKCIKLDKSNFKIWDGSNLDASEGEIAQQLTLHIDHVDPNATQEEILYELLLKAGFMPTQKVEKLEMAGKTVFSIAEGALLICLEDEITRELIDAVAEAEPMQFICLDLGFQGNDQLKANAVQTFAARNKGQDKAGQIVFRTV